MAGVARHDGVVRGLPQVQHGAGEIRDQERRVATADVKQVGSSLSRFQPRTKSFQGAPTRMPIPCDQHVGRQIRKLLVGGRDHNLQRHDLGKQANDPCQQRLRPERQGRLGAAHARALAATKDDRAATRRGFCTSELLWCCHASGKGRKVFYGKVDLAHLTRTCGRRSPSGRIACPGVSRSANAVKHFCSQI